MPWCPKCKSEYRDGFTICADCGSTLVEDQPIDEIEEQEENPVVEEIVEEQEVSSDKERGCGKRSYMYQDSADKASDNRSSAGILLFLGIVGIIVIVLSITGILPIRFGNTYLFHGVMGVMCVVFVVAGIISMKNAKFLDKQAESENSLKSVLLEWCMDNLNASEIDGRVGAQGVEQEVLYFRRFAYIKEKMNHQFVNLDQGFLDRLIDDVIYDSVFGDN